MPKVADDEDDYDEADRDEGPLESDLDDSGDDDSDECPHCGASIYHDVERCPNCCQYIASRDAVVPGYSVWVVAVIIVLIVVFALASIFVIG
jgi:hypothetical protein